MNLRLPICMAALLAFAPGLALAQKATGGYEGTATITVTEASGKDKAEYGATVKGRIPMESADRAEADPSGAPWVAKITTLNTEQEATAKGLDGKFMRVTCKLSAPIEIPMMAQGSLELDARKKTYAMYIALVSMKDVPVDCVNSQSGPFKSKKGVALSLGTYFPHLGHNSLPYADPTRLKAKHSLAESSKKTSIQAEWDLTLKK